MKTRRMQWDHHIDRLSSERLPKICRDKNRTTIERMFGSNYYRNQTESNKQEKSYLWDE